MPRAPGWTDDDLRRAVADSRSLKQVADRLGVTVGGGTYASLRRHIARLQLDDSHLPGRSGGRRGVRAWSDDELRAAVAASASMAQVQRRLGYRPSGGMHRYLSAYMRRLDLDTSHFTGQGWARGGAGERRGRVRPLTEILVTGSSYNNARLRRRLVAAGLLAPRCARCGLDEWQGRPLPLALDHVNGDPSDNRLENLRILCPNCHALTETWCGRNRGRRTPTG